MEKGLARSCHQVLKRLAAVLLLRDESEEAIVCGSSTLALEHVADVPTSKIEFSMTTHERTLNEFGKKVVKIFVSLFG